MRMLLGLLPLAVLALVGYAVRPRSEVTAPVRLTLVRTAVLVGAYACGTVEFLSATGQLTTAGILVTWLVALGLAGTAAAWRRRVAPAEWTLPRLPGNRSDRLLLFGLGGLVLSELVIVFASPPNTYDSQTYHLPRIEHWLANESVAAYPTRIHRQVTHPPGAEYLLLQLRALTDGDALYNLVQFAAALICLAAATRITAQLGGDGRAQLVTAFVLGTVPMFVLQSTSTQSDLVMAAASAALATLVLDGLDAPAAWSRTVLISAAVGLIAVSKLTGLLVAAALLLWWAARWIRRAPVAVVGTGLATLLGAALLAGPQAWRMQVEFGHPLGPEYLRNTVGMNRHDPGAVLVNGLRQAHTIFDTPVAALRDASAALVRGVANLVGVEVNDPLITFVNTEFPSVAWYPSEDKAAYPVQALLISIGIIVFLFRPSASRSGLAGHRRVFAALVVLGAVLHAATVRWQPWGNRLVLYLVVLAAPFAGLWIAALWRRASATATPRRGYAARRAVAAVTVVLVVVGGVAGWMSAMYGWPRRLVGTQSVLVLSDWETRFVTRPAWADDFAIAGAAVRATGATRVGLVQDSDTWEYPWWLVLDGADLIPLQSQLVKTPRESTEGIQAIVCTVEAATCQRYAPDWRMERVGFVSYLLP